MTSPTTSSSETAGSLEPIDAPEAPAGRHRDLLRSIGAPLLAVVIFVAAWQAMVVSGWRPDYLLPGPGTVFQRLAEILVDPEFWPALARTLSRAVIGFAIAAFVGTAIGLAAAGSKLLRASIGSLITGLQTMPSVVWFPLAILLLGLGEQAIALVVVLGAAPSIANGVLSGVDQLPPAYLRLGRVLGARRFTMYRYIVIPGALPSYVAGLNQGWAFAWRSLMAGELLVLIPGAAALGNRLAFAQEFGDATGLLAHMIVILVIGMIADRLFSAWSQGLRHARGLADV
jgi:NitT/TauT family transport system permease protein